MIARRLWSRVPVWSVLALTGLTLGGGCVPVDRGQVGAFIEDLLRNATAAFLW